MKKKVEDYFTAVSSPYGDSGSIQSSGGTPMGTPVRQEFQYKNGVQIPVSSGHLVPNPVAELDKQMALKLAERNAQVLATTPITQAGKEPAATPVEYAPIPETNLYPAAGTQRETPLMTITSGAGQEPDPVFAGLTGPTTRPNYAPQAATTNVLRDSAGNPVISGNGTPIGIPNQTVGNTASGGKGGANYQSGDALKQITGGK